VRETIYACIETISKSDLGEIGREAVNGLIELGVRAEVKFSEREGEVVNRLVERGTEREVGERRREFINSLVKSVVKSEAFKGSRKVIYRKVESEA